MGSQQEALSLRHPPGAWAPREPPQPSSCSMNSPFPPPLELQLHLSQPESLAAGLGGLSGQGKLSAAGWGVQRRE